MLVRAPWPLHLVLQLHVVLGREPHTGPMEDRKAKQGVAILSFRRRNVRERERDCKWYVVWIENIFPTHYTKSWGHPIKMVMGGRLKKEFFA